MLINAIQLSLPLQDPVAKFLIILLIILIIPIVSERIKIPHLLGMIIAGVVIGPYGFNLLARDSSIILSGTAGLLYIMFLAGLEIDMNDFKKNMGKSTALGLYGFLIPMTIGTFTGLYLLNMRLDSSILLASMFASHTLITYPIVSKLGISRNTAVNITVGSTLITNILALLVLAVIVGMNEGEINQFFWIRLSLSFVAFTLIILFLFPILARWFFKNISDNVSQYIFVLVIVFLGAVLSQLAGIEAIIGAFMGGLALNKLIPKTSALMNRVDFVGNAIFIPFFLIGVGMLIDYRAFTNPETLFVAIIMSAVATLGKFLAAWLTQKNFHFSKQERMIIFGLSNSQAAATLAAVLIGYNIILGQNPDGTPIRLLSDAVLNGTVIMILVTCTIASFVTQKSAKQIALLDQKDNKPSENQERILIPISNPNSLEELITISTLIKSKNNQDGLYALNIISTENEILETEKKSIKLLEQAKILASGSDIELKTLLRYDFNLISGVTNVIKEHSITDLIVGLHEGKGVSDTFLGKLTKGILSKSNITTYIYKSIQPISTIRRHLVIIPQKAEYEPGFSFWLSKVWNLAMNTGNQLVFYGSAPTLEIIRDIHANHPIPADFKPFKSYDEFKNLKDAIGVDDHIILLMSRKDQISYHPGMQKIPDYLNNYLKNNNFLLIYPIQSASVELEEFDLTNPSLLNAVEQIDVIGKTIAGIFRKR